MPFGLLIWSLLVPKEQAVRRRRHQVEVLGIDDLRNATSLDELLCNSRKQWNFLSDA